MQIQILHNYMRCDFHPPVHIKTMIFIYFQSLPHKCLVITVTTQTLHFFIPTIFVECYMIHINPGCQSDVGIVIFLFNLGCGSKAPRQVERHMTHNSVCPFDKDRLSRLVITTIYITRIWNIYPTMCEYFPAYNVTLLLDTL